MRGDLAVVAALCASACGRVGFDGVGGEDDGGTSSAIIVTVRGLPDDPDAGEPIVNASVMFEGANGIETHATDEAGRASAQVTGRTTIHIGYRTVSISKPTQEWRLYTVRDVAGGSTISIGFAPVETFVTIMVTLPVAPQAVRYQLRGPARCSMAGSGVSNVVTTTVSRCTGATIPIFAVAYNTGGDPIAWLDAGTFAADDQAQYTTSAAWQPLGTETVRYAGVPSSLEIKSDLIRHVGTERVILGEGASPAVGGDRDEEIVTFTGPVDSMRTTYTGAQPPIVGGVVVEPAPPDIGGVRAFEASKLVSLIENLDVQADGLVTWTFSSLARSPTAMIAELGYSTASDVPVRWIYVGGVTTRMQVPQLPAPLDEAAPMASTTSGVIVGLRPGSLSYDEALGDALELLFRTTFVLDVPLGWGLTVAEAGDATERRTRIHRDARRAVSAGD